MLPLNITQQSLRQYACIGISLYKPHIHTHIDYTNQILLVKLMTPVGSNKENNLYFQGNYGYAKKQL